MVVRLLLSRTGRPRRGEPMNDKDKIRNMGLAGVALLFIGVFCPILSVPIRGNMNYFQNGNGDGTIVLGLAAIAFFLIIADHVYYACLPAIGALLIMGYTFYSFHSKM